MVNEVVEAGEGFSDGGGGKGAAEKGSKGAVNGR
jgi:hypothetical protein